MPNFFNTDPKNEKDVLSKTFFDGVGNSGMDYYHSKESYYSFSYTKSIMKKSNLFDINVRYAPYRDKVKLLRKLIK